MKEKDIKKFYKYNDFSRMNVGVFEKKLLRFLELNEIEYDKKFLKQVRSAKGEFYANSIGKNHKKNACGSCWGEIY